MEKVSPVTVRKFWMNWEESTERTAKVAGSAMRAESERETEGKRRVVAMERPREGRRIRCRVCSWSCWNWNWAESMVVVGADDVDDLGGDDEANADAATKACADD